MVRKRLTTLAVAGLLAVGSAVVLTGVAQSAPPPAPQPPTSVVGKQAKPAIQPNSVNAKVEAPRGPTKAIKIDQRTGAPASTAKVAADASVSLGTFYNYAWREYVYTSVTNSSSVTKWIHLQLYVPGQSSSGASSYKDFYTSVPAGGTVYPYYYGVTGTYYAYLYVWDGSNYTYDESKTSANNTSVSVTVAKTVYSGYVLATFKNNGNNYVTINSQELAPYPTYGTYTGGPHYDYPAAGGGTISRYYYVGVGVPYGIVADVDGSSLYNSFRFAGVY